MPQRGLIFRVLIASPSDCAGERRVITEVIADWNAVHSAQNAAIAEPVKWETHSLPEMGDRPQGIINRQLVERCDVLIGTFWTRLGTPTGVAESGTAEEIEAFRLSGRPVMIYFSSAPVVPDSLEGTQYDALKNYKHQLMQDGLCSTYESLSNFREQLQRHFASQMIGLLRMHQIPAESSHSSNATQEAVNSAESFKGEFGRFLRKLQVEWSSEKNSDPRGMDEAKYILGSAKSELVHLRSQVIEDSTNLSGIMDDAIKRLIQLQRHELYMDGGESFRAFWQEGDNIISLLQSVPTEIDKLIAEPGR